MRLRCTRVFLWLFLLLGTTLPLSSCATAAPARRGPRPLPADSLAVLTAALRQARPAFSTQREALSAGIYRTDARPADVTNDRSYRSTVTDPHPGYVIQIAAYGDRSLAEQARARAELEFPTRTVLVEQAGAVYRVAVAGWQSSAEATADLLPVQRIYPGAWVRLRVLP